MAVPLAAVALATLAGCLYMDPINMPPMVQINPPAKIMRGQSAFFSATLADPDHDMLSLAWAQTTGFCPGDHARGNWPSEPWTPVQQFEVPGTVTMMDHFCVWAFATDSYGAVRADSYQADTVNHPPVARIELLQPDGAAAYPLYTDFRLSGESSTDEDHDDLTYAWDLRKPAASQASLQPCPDASGMDAIRCLHADAADEYEVILKVSDTHGGMSEPALKTLLVQPDAFPCLQGTVPELDAASLSYDPALAHKFQVTRVVDDGDPYPATADGSITHFAWFIARGDGPFAYVDRDYASYEIPPGTFGIGDQARVRVEISDRDKPRIDRVLLGCGTEAPVCAATAAPPSGATPGCLLRMTWSLSFQ